MSQSEVRGMAALLEQALEAVELPPSQDWEVDCHAQACAFVQRLLELIGLDDAGQASALSRLFGWRIEQQSDRGCPELYRCRVHYEGHSCGPWVEVSATTPRTAAILFIQRDLIQGCMGGFGSAPVEVVHAGRGHRYNFHVSYSLEYSAEPRMELVERGAQ